LFERPKKRNFLPIRRKKKMPGLGKKAAAYEREAEGLLRGVKGSSKKGAGDRQKRSFDMGRKEKSKKKLSIKKKKQHRQGKRPGEREKENPLPPS